METKGEVMAIQLRETNEGRALEVQVSGKIAHEDYVHFAPAFEQQVLEHGKLRVLFDMIDFHGWKARALWDDLKFDLRHYTDIDRLALVGDKRWEKGMGIVCRPFTTAKVRYFDRNQIDEARRWLESNEGSPTRH
jgi:hypothetical protein